MGALAQDAAWIRLWAVHDAWVDREARKGKGPSDHAPVVIDLDL